MASPTISCIVVEVVGARPFGQASFAFGRLRAIFDDFAKWLFLFEDNPINLLLLSWANLTISPNSVVSPDHEIAKITSFFSIIPISPWLASVGWIKKDGVPVEDNVAEIFLPIWPDFPTPVTITLPFDLKIIFTASSKFESKNSFSRFIPSISSFNTWRAVSIIFILFPCWNLRPLYLWNDIQF